MTVDLLTTDQISRFKRDGYLVLPGVLDPDLCRRARDQMWEVAGEHLPRMKRDDPATWGPVTEEENARLAEGRPEGGGDPYFSGSGHRFYVRNGAEELLLDLAPRALWQVAEQLLGQGTVVWPAGLDASGGATGPAFMCDDAVGGLVSHVGHAMGYPPEGTFRTEPALRLPASGPVWLNGQGTRGLYCTLPGSPPQAPGYPGAHSDGACYGRFRLQVSAYIDDLPPGCGGFTVWPGSHARIWTQQWEAFRGGEKHTDKSRPCAEPAATATPSSRGSRPTPSPSTATARRAPWSCGTPRSCTWRASTPPPTSSARRRSTGSSRRRPPCPTRWWWTPRTAASGGTGRSRCARPPRRLGSPNHEFESAHTSTYIASDHHMHPP